MCFTTKNKTITITETNGNGKSKRLILGRFVYQMRHEQPNK